jgi:hypothetical protein
MLSICVSLATPTTSRAIVSVLDTGNSIVCPIGSRSGQNRRAVASVTMIARDASAVSASVNARPRTIGMPVNEK